MLAKKIADYLASQGIGTVGSDLFVEFLPDSPDNVVAIYSTGGFNFNYSSVLGYDNPTIQVRVRNTDQLAAYNKIAAVYDKLQGLNTVTLDGSSIINVQALQSAPTTIGRDAKNRAEYTQNYTIMVRNKTTHRE